MLKNNIDEMGATSETCRKKCLFSSYVQKPLMIWVHPAKLLQFKISIIHHTAVLSSVHFTNLNTQTKMRNLGKKTFFCTSIV